MSKKLAIPLIIFLSIVVIGSSILLGIAIKSNFKFPSFSFVSSRSTKLVDEMEFNDLKDININSNTVDVDIIDSEVNTIKVQLFSNDPEEYKIEENDAIEVVLEEKTHWFSFGRKNGYIKIVLPKYYSNEITSIGKVGDIEVGNFENASIKIEATVGDIEIKKIDKANITLTTGDINITDVNELTTKTTTGDVEIINVNSIKAQTTTGDIEISNIKNDLKLQTTTGDVEIGSAIVNKNSSIKTTVGDVSIKGTTGCYVETKTKVGDIKVNNLDRKSDIILKIETRVGDVDVN